MQESLSPDFIVFLLFCCTTPAMHHPGTHCVIGAFRIERAPMNETAAYEAQNINLENSGLLQTMASLLALCASLSSSAHSHKGA